MAEQIGLDAVFEDEEFQRGIGDYNKSVSQASGETEEGASAMSAAFEGLSAVGAIAFGALTTVIGGATAALYSAVEAAFEAEGIMTRVGFIVDNVADRTGVTTEEVEAMAGAMSQVVPFDDEVIAQAAAMGLTYDGVTQDNIEPLLAASADLATFTGKDLPSAMKDLSLAITDPDRAMRLFKESSITLTEEQEKTLKSLEETGDTAGTTQFILERLAEKGIIGLAEVMGDTAEGKFEIMKTALGNLQEVAGDGLLDALKGVFDKITEFANDPQTIAFFTDLGTQIGEFASMVVDSVPSIMEILGNLSEWFQENKPIIVGILAAIGVALIAFGYTAAAAGIAALAGLWPVILIMAIIGVAAALLYTIWTENWGGIQEATAEVWAVLQPIFDTISQWIAVNLPIALQFLADMWNTVLLPAIQMVFEWLIANVVPLFISLVQWLSTNVPAALSTLAGFWTGTLLPAIQAVWGWIQANIIPLFQAVALLMSTVFGVAVTVLAGIWQNVLLPALQAVWNSFQQNILPVLQSVVNTISGQVMPILKTMSDFISSVLRGALDGLTATIQGVIQTIKDMAEALANIVIPDVLMPGSPTPFEIGLKGINEQLKQLAGSSLPAVTHEMNVLGSVRDVPGANGLAAGSGSVTSSSSVRNYLFGAQFNVNNQAGLFDIMNGLAGT